jgi:hypothetical protein
MFTRSTSYAGSPSFRRASFGLAAASVLLSGSPARAVSIVADGGFESAGANTQFFYGQSIDGGSWVVGGSPSSSVYVDSGDAYQYAGQNALNLTLANLDAPNTIQQTLSTVAGQTYVLTFWANSDETNIFSATENGVAVSGTPTSIVENGFPSATSNSSLFQQYTGTFSATSASTVLSFTATGEPMPNTIQGSLDIDNVTVQTAATVTPEPEPLVLVLSGVVGLGGVLRRRIGGRTLA